jgi:hypothetical protein
VIIKAISHECDHLGHLTAANAPWWHHSSAQDAVKVVLTASRAAIRPAGAQRLVPLCIAFSASKLASLFNHFVVPTIDPNGLPVDKRIGNRLPRIVKDSPEGSPRHAHTLTGFFMG